MRTDKKIVSYSYLKKIRLSADSESKKIVFTSGCYDILHIGHLIHFNYCKNKGDILVVSVGNDKTLRDLKGPGRPINNEKFRARLVAALEIVDYVVISKEAGVMDHNDIVRFLRPDYYVVPSTDKMIKEKKKLVELNGGILIGCRRLPPGNIKGGISTTKIDEKMRKN